MKKTKNEIKNRGRNQAQIKLHSEREEIMKQTEELKTAAVRERNVSM